MSVIPQEDAQKNVERGAQILDAMRPGWAHAIALDKLDMNEPCLCVLGQIYGHYSDGVRKLPGYRDWGWDVGDYYGFMVRGLGLETWDQLDTLWREQIRMRTSQ